MRKSLLIFLLVSIIVLSLSLTISADFNINIRQSDNAIVRIMGDVHIEEDSIITGDVVVIMGNIKIDGQVQGDVVSVLGDIEINNTISGDLISVLGSITEGAEGRVLGEKTVVNIGNMNLGWTTNLGTLFRWNFRFFRLLVFFALAVLIFSFMPEQQRQMAAVVRKKPLRELLVGLIGFLFFPVVLLLFFITIVGIPLIPFVILAFIIARFIGYVAVVYMIGSQIEKSGERKINVYLKILIGVLILGIINIIPVIGFIFYFVVTFLSLGVIIDTRFGTNRPWFKNKKEQPES